MAVIQPIHFLDDLFLRGDKSVHRTHSVLLLGASTDASERCDAIVDDDPDLLAWSGCAFQN